MQPELPSMNLVLSESPSHKVEPAQQQCTIKWDVVKVKLWQFLTRSWRYKHATWKSCPNAFGFYSCHDAICQVSTYSFIVCSIRLKKKRLGSGFVMVLCVIQPPQSGQLRHTTLFWDFPERHLWRKMFTVHRTLVSAHGQTVIWGG